MTAAPHQLTAMASSAGTNACNIHTASYSHKLASLSSVLLGSGCRSVSFVHPYIAVCAAKRLTTLKQSPTVFLASQCSMAGFEMKNRYGGKPNGLTSADSRGPEVKCLQVKIDWSISQIGRCSEVAPSSMQCAFVAMRHTPCFPLPASVGGKS